MRVRNNVLLSLTSAPKSAYKYHQKCSSQGCIKWAWRIKGKGWKDRSHRRCNTELEMGLGKGGDQRRSACRESLLENWAWAIFIAINVKGIPERLEFLGYPDISLWIMIDITSFPNILLLSSFLRSTSFVSHEICIFAKKPLHEHS